MKGSLLVLDREGSHWCSEHMVMALMHPMSLAFECPFCWFLTGRGKEHSCDGARCYCQVVKEAVRNQTAPWMTAEGRASYRRALHG